MASCPHCRRTIPRLAGKCPACGRELGALDLSSGAVSRPPPDGLGGHLVIEGLEGPAAPKAAPKPLPKQPAAAPGASPPTTDDSWELDPFERDVTQSTTPAPGAPGVEVATEDSAFELDPFERDVSQGHAPAGAPPAPASTPGGGLELAVPTRPERVSAAGAGAAVATSPVEDLRHRAEEVAAYGPKPKGLVDSVQYALRVRARRAEMHSEIARLEVLHRDARKAETEALASLADAARDAGISAEGDAATEASAAESRVAEESAALGRLQATHDKRLAELDRAHELATKDVPALQAREADLARRYAECGEKLKRAETRLKRVEIEVRNRRALAAQQRAAGAADEAERLEAEVRTFDGERPAREAEAKAEREATAALEAELAEIRRQIAAGLGKGSLVEDERRKAEVGFRRQKGDRARRVEESSADARDRLAEVGRRVFARHADAAELAEPRGAAAAAKTARELLERELDVLKVAMDLYDIPSAKTGWMVVFGAAGLVVLAIAALLALS